MRYKVTFIRHGGPEDLTFDTRRDAETFAEWLEPSSAGVNPEISEIDEG